MQTLSLWQPWASAVVLEIKGVETRSWHPKSKGLRFGMLAIHATATWRREVLASLSRELSDGAIMRHALQGAGVANLTELPLGAVLGIVDVVGWDRTDTLRLEVGDLELAFGDFSPDRWGILFDRAWRFRDPIPAKGRQGLWQWEPPGNWQELCDFKGTKV